MHFVDSHCHLDFSHFDDDRTAILARAREAGVVTFVNPGCDLATSKKALSIAEAEEGVYSAVGLHPSEAAHFLPELIEEFHTMAVHEKIVAVGECGLDFFKYGEDDAMKQLQEAAFRAQLDLATELDLPVIIHSRAAETETVAILREYPQLSGVLHCYTGDPAPALAAVELGWHIGFTGIITFKNASAVREVVSAVPLAQLLLETDSPFLAPEPHRGARAEPSYIPLIAQQVADIKKLSLAEVAQATTTNARTLFRI